MRAKVTKVDMAAVAPKLLALKNDRDLGLYASAEAARLMDKYVPYRSGDLAGSVDTSTPWRVKYTMPYAIYVWNGRGMTFSTQVHPKARSHWSSQLEYNPYPLALLLTLKVKEM